MFQQFVDRDNELSILEEEYKKVRSSLLILYGRRRVGKTELITRFIRNKPHVYFLADTRTDRENLNELQSAMSAYLNNPLFGRAEFKDWLELFREFGKLIKEKVALVVDEFPYLIESNRAIPSIFQKIWDQVLSKKEICLILLGSSISMMESNVLDYRAPLYGRRTSQLQLRPFKFRQLGRFLPYCKEELVKVYGVTDGIPLYLQKLDPNLNFEENLEVNVFQVGKFLYQEGEFLLREELREMPRYFSILKAIAQGHQRFGEIANFTGFDKTLVSKYLDNLRTIRVIMREHPITQYKETRNARYVFADNYFNFWFRYVYPHKSLIEEGKAKRLLELIKTDLNTYLGKVYEHVVKEFLWVTKLPFSPTKLGRWWEKEKEIDLIALDEKSRHAGFFEVKWSSFKLGEAKRKIASLEEKSMSVDWNRKSRNEHFGLIAKNLERKEELRELGYLCYDLRDILVER